MEVLSKRAYQVIEDDSTKQQAMITIFGEADEVLGSWDNWKTPIKLESRYNYFTLRQQYYAMLDLEPGRYEFVFRKGDRHFHDTCQPSVTNQFGGCNNIMVLVYNKHDEKNIDFTNVTWEKYNLQHNKFDHLHGHSMTSIGNSFYVFGGSQNLIHSNDIYKLTFSGHHLDLIDVDSINGFAPSPRSFHAAIPYGDKILFVGGLNDKEVLQDHFVFATSNNTWYQSKIEGQITARERASMTFYAQEELLVYFGGYYSSPDLEVEKVYNDVYYMNIQTMMWVKMNVAGPQPQERYGHTATQINDKMYVFGGANGKSENYNDVWVLDFTKQQWNQITCHGQPPEPRHGHTANQIASKICIFGGKNNRNIRLNDIHFFDFSTYTWIKPQMHGEVPMPRYFHAADVHQDDELWVLGGNIGMKYIIHTIHQEK